MAIAHDIVTQLEELWENAEPGPFEEGDTIIIRHADGRDYSIRAKAGYSADMAHIRVIERAKPKAPEWEAVVASYLHDDPDKREVYFRSTYGGWESEAWVAEDGDLVDPVPLVEMPDREELIRAFLQVGIDHEFKWPESDTLADAVLEMLKRR